MSPQLLSKRETFKEQSYFDGKAQSRQEWIEKFEAAIADPEFSSKIPFLFDYRMYKGNSPKEIIIARANYLGALQGKISSTIAILVTDPLHYGLGRMLQVYTSRYGFQIEVFTSPNEALKYLSSG